MKIINRLSRHNDGSNTTFNSFNSSKLLYFSLCLIIPYYNCNFKYLISIILNSLQLKPSVKKKMLIKNVFIYMLIYFLDFLVTV